MTPLRRVAACGRGEHWRKKSAGGERGGKPGRGNEMEGGPRERGKEEGEERGGGNKGARHKRCAPVTQKQNEDNGRKQESQEHCITNTGDGLVNDGGLIVERLDAHAGGKRGANLFDLSVNFVSDIKRIAVRLTMHAKQDGGLAVGRDHGVDRRNRRRNVRDTTETVDARLEVVGGNFPKLILRNGVGRQAVAENGKRGEGEAMRLNLGRRRQFRLQASDDGIDALQRQNHVARPVKEKIDLRGTAAGNRLNFL